MTRRRQTKNNNNNNNHKYGLALLFILIMMAIVNQFYTLSNLTNSFLHVSDHSLDYSPTPPHHHDDDDDEGQQQQPAAVSTSPLYSQQIHSIDTTANITSTNTVASKAAIAAKDETTTTRAADDGNVTTTTSVTNDLQQSNKIDSNRISTSTATTATTTTTTTHKEDGEKTNHRPNRTKTCRITNQTLPPYSQHPDLQYYPHYPHHTTATTINHNNGHIRVLFLLGYPNTGTSALHFLLATSPNVSTLRDPNLMNSRKEGWSVTKLKYRHTEAQRWDGKLEYVNWKRLARQYGREWDIDGTVVGNVSSSSEGDNTNSTTQTTTTTTTTTTGRQQQRQQQTKKILLENSPPEIQAPTQLMETFTNYTDTAINISYTPVKFLLLIRGDCTYHNEPDYPSTLRAEGYRNVMERYPRDTYVLRFEDLCLRWEDVMRDLRRWEPLLGDVDGRKSPGRTGKSKWRNTSVDDYCAGVLGKWGGDKVMDGGDGGGRSHPLKEWGYDTTVKEI